MLLVLVAFPLAKAHCSMKEGERNRKLGDKRGPNPGIQVGPESSASLFSTPFQLFAFCSESPRRNILHSFFQVAIEIFIRIPSKLNPLSAFSPWSHTIRDHRGEIPNPHHFIPQMAKTHGEVQWCYKKKIHNSTTKGLAISARFIFLPKRLYRND